MGIAVTDEQMALAEAVAAFAARVAPVEDTRKLLDSGPRDGEDRVWKQFVSQGFATMHLPDESGAVATLADVAIMLEQAGRSLLPGPLLPTVLASVLIERHGTAVVQAELREAFARGARGACDLSASQLTAVASGDGWRLTGTTGLILGAPGADYLLLRAAAESEDAWLVVPAKDVVVREVPGVDGTRTLGRVECVAGQVVPASRINVTAGQVKAVAAALFAAEAAGIARWCQETGVAYAKIREQFGRPIGAFQAVGNERLSIGSGLGAGRKSPARIASDAGAAGPDVEFSMGTLTSDYNTLGALNQRMIIRSLGGLEPAADGAVLKLVNSQMSARAGRFGLLCGGQAAAADGPSAALLAAPKVLIGGGTVEMQLNMIGERILGLPRS